MRWVQDGSPADRAGIEKGDLIAAVNGDPITRLDDLYKHLDSGGDLRLTVVRGTDEREVEVVLAETTEV